MRHQLEAGNEVDLERAADARMAAKAPREALPLYEASAAEHETPPPRLAVKTARAALAAGAFETAARWCVRVVDAEASYADWVAASAILRKCPPEAIRARRTGLRVALAATWTTKTFAPLLELAAARCGLHIDVWEADYGQYFNETLRPDSALFGAAPDVVILLPDDRALGLLARVEADPTAVETEIARWTNVWEGVGAQSNATLLQLGFARRPGDVFGNFSAGFAGSLSAQIAQLNHALAERANARDIAFVDVDRLSARAGTAAWFDERSWYVAKIPYAPAAMCQLAHETAVVLAARFGLSRRCLVLDLDNTLWGGVIGDDGLSGIQLGGGGVEGQAFVDFQHSLKGLATRGLLLAVCSKNEEVTAREPFERHPEMVLALEDISAFVANWEPKSENLLKISRDLDLGLESLTFFDDNPYEREEVRRHVPDVDVPILPDDPTGFRAALEAYPYFEPSGFTAADAARGAQYRARAQATSLRETAGSLEDYQKSLKMVARIGAVDELNITRVVQLINKTNQFNLTTQRRNRAELEAFMADPAHCHFWVRLADRFGDHGLIAVVLGRTVGEVLEIDTFLMSCRVIGRGVEAVIAAEIGRIAEHRGISTVRGIYIPTERNGMVADLYSRLGFAEVGPTDARGPRTFTAPPRDPQTTAYIRVEYVT